MNRRYQTRDSYDLELKLHELSSRRRLLEQQHEQRMYSLRQLSDIRQNSMNRLCEAMAQQNQLATLRNRKMLEDMTFTNNTVGQRSGNYSSNKENDLRGMLSIGKINASNSADGKLQSAKAQYLKRREALLPTWHRIQTAQLEEKLRAIKKERVLSERRKELLKIEMTRENRVKYDLEKQRQELLISLAEEQRMIMEAEANAMLIRQEGAKVDVAVMQQIREASLQVQDVVNHNLRAMQADALNANPQLQYQQLQQQALQRQQQQQSGVGVLDSMSALKASAIRQPYEYSPAQYHSTNQAATRNNSNNNNSTAAAQLEHQRQLQQIPSQYNQQYQYHQQHQPQQLYQQQQQQLLQRPPPLHMDFNTRATARDLATVDSADEWHFAPDAAADKQQSPLLESKPAFVKRSGSIDIQQQGIGYDRHDEVVGSPETLPQSSNQVDDSMHYSISPASSFSLRSSLRTTATAPITTAAATSNEGSASDSDYIRNHESAGVGATTGAAAHSSSTHSLLREAGDEVNRIFGERKDDLAKESDDSFDFESALPVKSSAVAAAATAGSPRRAPGTPVNRVSFDPTLPASETALDTPRSGGISPTHAASTIAVVSGSGTEKSNQQPVDERSKRAIVSLSIRDCSAFLQPVIAAINAAQDDVVAAAAGSSAAAAAQSTSRIVKEFYSPSFSIEAHDARYSTDSRSESIADLVAMYHDQRLEVASISSMRLQLLGDAVLAVVQVHATTLIPSDAFTGVVTIEKLKKEYKKNGPPGIQQLWEAISKHLQKLVEANFSNLSYLSTCFTNALVAHTVGDDRDRLTRKVSKLLQLAMIPSEKKSKGSPSLSFMHGSLEDSIGSNGGGLSLSDSYSSLPNKSTAAAGSPFSTSTSMGALLTAAPTLNASKYSGIASSSSPATTTTATAAGIDSNHNRRPGNMSALYNIGGGNISDLVAEFEDAEIMDDESIEKPPPLRDLDALQQSATAGNSNNSRGGRSSMADEFDF